jgi:hypothetical protein
LSRQSGVIASTFHTLPETELLRPLY